MPIKSVALARWVTLVTGCGGIAVLDSHATWIERMEATIGAAADGVCIDYYSETTADAPFAQGPTRLIRAQMTLPATAARGQLFHFRGPPPSQAAMETLLWETTKTNAIDFGESGPVFGYGDTVRFCVVRRPCNPSTCVQRETAELELTLSRP